MVSAGGIVSQIFIYLCAGAIAAKWVAQMALGWLNQRHVQRHAGAAPASVYYSHPTLLERESALARLQIPADPVGAAA